MWKIFSQELNATPDVSDDIRWIRESCNYLGLDFMLGGLKTFARFLGTMLNQGKSLGSWLGEWMSKLFIYLEMTWTDNIDSCLGIGVIPPTASIAQMEKTHGGPWSQTLPLASDTSR